MIVSMDTLIDRYAEELSGLGIGEARARAMAKAQIEVHAFGTDTHGIPPLKHMIEMIRTYSDRILPPREVRSFGALSVADSSLTPSVESILWGSEKAAALAAAHGIGFVSLINGGWVGTMGYHLAAHARKGYLLMGWNQTSHLAFTPPHGGRDPRFNTSPMAFSFPLGDGTYRERPVVADFSTAAISMGKTARMRRAGERTAEELYRTREGEPSDDPRVTEKGGTIMPFGGKNYGFRGTALALLIEAMTAAAGAVPVNEDKKGGQNVHVLALNIEAMGGLEGYGELMEQLMDWILACEPSPGSTGVRYPGQRGWEALEKARREGVEVDDL